MQLVAEIKKKLLDVIFIGSYGPTAYHTLSELVPGSLLGVLLRQEAVQPIGTYRDAINQGGSGTPSHCT